MTTERIGEAFAGLTALCWVVSGVCFEHAGRRVGSVTVNVLRMSIALALMALLCRLSRGMAIPWDADAHVWGWLLASGFIGFFLCDLCLFRAYVLVGARRSMLMLSLAPVVATVLDYAVIHAPPTLLQGIGILVTLAGVTWVIAERSGREASPHADREQRLGIALALIAAVLQACGAITAKLGMGRAAAAPFDPLAATFIRIFAGLVGFVLFVCVTGRWKRVAQGARDFTAVAYLSAGAVIGPVLGVACFLASLQRVPSGVTQTLIATTPVLVGPFAAFQRHDRVSLRATLGAIVAVVGVILLCAA
ncbi:MAG: DMT family transporter [Tepidisphaeraceae bacterium]